MRKTTASTSGITTLRSWACASVFSCAIAVGPPTWASASGTACTAARMRSTVRAAAALSGLSFSTARVLARVPSVDLSGASTSATPSMPFSAAATAGAASALLITSAGLLW